MRERKKVKGEGRVEEVREIYREQESYDELNSSSQNTSSPVGYKFLICTPGMAK